jgi:hypothetical protein
MPQSLSKVILQMIFTTKDREPADGLGFSSFAMASCER